MVRLGFVVVITTLLYQLLQSFVSPAFAFLYALAFTLCIYFGMRALTEGLNHSTSVNNFYMNGNVDLYSDKDYYGYYANQIDARFNDLRLKGQTWGSVY